MLYSCVTGYFLLSQARYTNTNHHINIILRAMLIFKYRNNKQTVRFLLPDINQFGMGKNQDV